MSMAKRLEIYQMNGLGTPGPISVQIPVILGQAPSELPWRRSAAWRLR